MMYYDDVTDFIFVEDEPRKADVIFIPGGPWGELAEKAAQLYHSQMANLLVPSGKFSTLLEKFPGPASPETYVGMEYETECDFFADILMRNQVPREAILQEREATFTYENGVFSRRLLEKQGIKIHTAILVCQAFHARRALMYYQLEFPEVKFFVCPAETQGINRRNWHEDPDRIDMVLGEVERCGSQFHDIMKGYRL